jgi:ABC-type phosphate transport system substrate-binding protein
LPLKVTKNHFVETIGKKDGKELRADDQTMLSEDDKALVTGVKGDKFAIGFFGFSYYDANKEQTDRINNERTEAIRSENCLTVRFR